MNSEDEILELAAWGLDESRDRDDGMAADGLTRLQYRLLRSNVLEVPAVIVHARSRPSRTYCPSGSFFAEDGRHAAKWCG
jgi:hypothetical protein